MRHTNHSDNPARQNVEEVARLERAGPKPTRGQRLSQAITDAVGTGQCAFLHVIALVAWVAWNTRVGPPALRFDPYPFGLLTMWVSLEGVVLAILVLITQNRMSRQTDRRDHLDLQVDLLAEQEMTLMLRILTQIGARVGVEIDAADKAAVERLKQPTNLRDLMAELDRRFERDDRA